MPTSSSFRARSNIPSNVGFLLQIAGRPTEKRGDKLSQDRPDDGDGTCEAPSKLRGRLRASWADQRPGREAGDRRMADKGGAEQTRRRRVPGYLAGDAGPRAYRRDVQVDGLMFPGRLERAAGDSGHGRLCSATGIDGSALLGEREGKERCVARLGVVFVGGRRGRGTTREVCVMSAAMAEGTHCRHSFHQHEGRQSCPSHHSKACNTTQLASIERYAGSSRNEMRARAYCMILRASRMLTAIDLSARFLHKVTPRQSGTPPGPTGHSQRHRRPLRFIGLAIRKASHRDLAEGRMAGRSYRSRGLGGRARRDQPAHG